MIALVGLGGALFLVTKTPAPPPAVNAAPSVKMKVGAKPARLDGSMLGGAATMGEKYKPTSAYMEPGADSDVTELSFDKGSNGGAQAGSFDESVVQEVMYAHQEDMIGCYADGLAEDETLAGEVKFHFRVAKDGHVALVKITSSGLRHKDTEDCLVDAARRWRFPATGQAGLAKFDTSFEFAAQ
jgi:hypothetical protein